MYLIDRSCHMHIISYQSEQLSTFSIGYHFTKAIYKKGFQLL